jgi:hypothetical protein
MQPLRIAINLLALIFVVAQGFMSGSAIAQERAAEDKSFVFEVGPAAERDLKNKAESYGAALAASRHGRDIGRFTLSYVKLSKVWACAGIAWLQGR